MLSGAENKEQLELTENKILDVAGHVESNGLQLVYQSAELFIPASLGP